MSDWRFDLVRPCVNCPFRTDVRFHFRRQRAEDIVRAVIERDQTFQCHKTVDYSGDEAAAGERPQNCAGALILHEKLGKPNWRFRFAHGLGLYNPERLDMEAPVVSSVEEFIELQSESGSCLKP
jgi:hypothetical protein